VPVLDDFLFLFFGRSEAAPQAGRTFWERCHQRADQDPPSSPAVIQAQIETHMYYMPKLDAKDPFAHLREVEHPTLVLNGVDDVMIPTINSAMHRVHLSTRSMSEVGAGRGQARRRGGSRCFPPP